MNQQEELDKEEDLTIEFEELFSKHNLDNLNLIKEILDKEIRLSETAIK